MCGFKLSCRRLVGRHAVTFKVKKFYCEAPSHFQRVERSRISNRFLDPELLSHRISSLDSKCADKWYQQATHSNHLMVRVWADCAAALRN